MSQDYAASVTSSSRDQRKLILRDPFPGSDVVGDGKGVGAYTGLSQDSRHTASTPLFKEVTAMTLSKAYSGSVTSSVRRSVGPPCPVPTFSETEKGLGLYDCCKN